MREEALVIGRRMQGMAVGDRDQLEHRLVLPDGRRRWFRSTFVRVEAGAARTISGVSVDVTDVHDELERLRAGTARQDPPVGIDTV